MRTEIRILHNGSGVCLITIPLILNKIQEKNLIQKHIRNAKHRIGHTMGYTVRVKRIH